MKYLEKIEGSLGSSGATLSSLATEQAASAERAAALHTRLEAAKANLAKRRQELDRFRRSLFESGGTPGYKPMDDDFQPPPDAPPAYGG